MEAVDRGIHSFDWITVTLIVSLIFLVIAKSLFYGRFLNFIILPFNNKYIFMYNKKDRLVNGFQIFFTLFQASNFALFIYLCCPLLFGADSRPAPLTYLVLLGVVLSYLIIKIIVQLANGFVYNNEKVIIEFIFKKLSYLNYSGLIMFLANVVLTYILKDSLSVVYVAIFLIVTVNVVGLITLIKNHQKLITSHFFYFILYLCALEIAPLVIILNALTY
jgi:hypothetical protein